MMHRIEDWTDAYDNGGNIAGGERWPGLWVKPAQLFRNQMLVEGRAELDLAYSSGARNKLDLFMPQDTPKGLVVFVHGGFWLRLDRSIWSHLAQGPLAHGYAVAMPSYTLCPENNVSGITKEVAKAITFAAGLVDGPIRLIGHSAGGQQVTRMISHTSPLEGHVSERIVNTVSLSGLHDLRSLLSIAMNQMIGLDMAEAVLESPALLQPINGARLTCWVGAGERSEFLRQNALLANIWKGLGVATDCVEEPDRHHFNVVDGLIDPRHPLTLALMQE
jgi:arylformamidase